MRAAKLGESSKVSVVRVDVGFRVMGWCVACGG